MRKQNRKVVEAPSDIVIDTSERLKLSELAPLINDFIHSGDDFLPDCVSVMVCARVMTEGGV